MNNNSTNFLSQEEACRVLQENLRKITVFFGTLYKTNFLKNIEPFSLRSNNAYNVEVVVLRIKVITWQRTKY